MKWISLKDRLPEKNQLILLYLPHYGETKDFRIATIYIHEDLLIGATHWMPTPEPPEKE